MNACSCPNWVEIDLDVLAQNTHKIKEYLSSNCRLLAVVKADGYSHGALPVARIFLDSGADYLGVATLAEAVELRDGGIDDAPILVFTPLGTAEAEHVVQYNLTATIAQVQSAQALSAAAVAAGETVRAHVKVDTGLSRFGILPERLESFVRGVFRLPGITWEGVYSHLANGYGGSGRICRRQLNLFVSTVLDLVGKGFVFPIKHLGNSPVLFDSREYHLDMVRIGNALYGLGSPGAADKEAPSLDDAWSFKGRIVQLKEVVPGTPVGYGGHFVARRTVQVATVSAGLSDGFGIDVSAQYYRPGKLVRSLIRVVLERLGLAERFGLTPTSGWVRVRGEIAAVIGKVGMQHCMVDVTDIPGVAEGDVVELTALRASVSSRVPRLYFSEGKARLARVAGEYRELSEAERAHLPRASQAHHEVAAGATRGE